VNKENIQYYLIRILTFPFGFLPFSWIHAIGRAIGIMGFYCMRQYRKRALSNLSLARDLALKPEEIQSLQKVKN
jgi:lauroyl/myristoyl acyltransferase